MPAVLFFDTETTGLWKFNEDISHPTQPHVVQVAAQLYDLDKDFPISTFAACIKPDLYNEIEEGAAKAHGITKDHADKYGFRASTALGIFKHLFQQADLVVAHNFQFDSKLIRKLDLHISSNLSNMFDSKPNFCTMTSPAVTDFCGLLNKWNKPKWPKLIELHEKLFDKGFSGAHDALVDVIALRDCFIELNKRKIIGV